MSLNQRFWQKPAFRRVATRVATLSFFFFLIKGLVWLGLAAFVAFKVA
jgi:hypothetical protein